MKTTIWLRTVPIIFMFFIIPLGMQSQYSDFSCYVYDSYTKEPLPYANIMFLSRPYGVTTDTNGYFEILALHTKINDSLAISYVGYETRIMQLEQLRTKRIYLSPQSITLDEIIVKPEKGKAMKSSTLIMNKFRKKDCFLVFAPSDLIAGDRWIPIRPLEPSIEAIYFPGNSSTEYLPMLYKIRLYITNYKIPVKFRLRIFKADTNLHPGIDLINEPIIIKGTKVNELIEVDVKEYNIALPEDGVFVGLELLLLPENVSEVKIEDSTITLYSPFLNYVITDDTICNWIYSAGKWKLNNNLHTTKFIGQGKKQHYKPAISIILQK